MHAPYICNDFPSLAPGPTPWIVKVDLGLLVVHGPLARSLPYPLRRIECFRPSFERV
jgi:hypothetical protein